jgi:hypothetical protein
MLITGDNHGKIWYIVQLRGERRQEGQGEQAQDEQAEAPQGHVE